MKFGGGPKCRACEKSVGAAELVQALGHSWHTACFCCQHETCKKCLRPGEFQDHDGKPYCPAHYQQLFGPKGIGFGVMGDTGGNHTAPLPDLARTWSDEQREQGTMGPKKEAKPAAAKEKAKPAAKKDDSEQAKPADAKEKAKPAAKKDGLDRTWSDEQREQGTMGPKKGVAPVADLDRTWSDEQREQGKMDPKKAGGGGKAALRVELEALSLAEMEKLCRDLGVSEGDRDEAMDATDSKAAYIALIKATASPAAIGPPGGSSKVPQTKAKTIGYPKPEAAPDIAKSAPGLKVLADVSKPKAPGPSAAAAPPTNEMADNLRTLKSLLDEGILTQAEFDAQKAKVLAAYK